MGWLQNLVVKIKGDKTQLDSTLSQTQNSIKNWSSKVAAFISAAFATAALKIFVDWFKATDAGAKAVNITLSVTRQLLTDIITRQQLHIGESIKLAKQEEQIRIDNRKEGAVQKIMMLEINKLRFQAADATKSHAEKLELLTKAQEKQDKLMKYRIEDATEELHLVQDKLKHDNDNTKLKERFYLLLGQIAEAEDAYYSEGRRMQTQITALRLEEQTRIKELGTALKEAFEKDADAAHKAMEKAANDLEKLKDSYSSFTDFTNRISPSKLASENLPRAFADAPVLGAGKARGGATLAGAPHALPEGFQQMRDESVVALENFNSDLSRLFQEGVMIITDSIEDMFAAMTSGDWSSFGNKLLIGFANFLSMFGKLLIAYAVSLEAFQSTMGNIFTWPVALDAGVGAIAIAGLIKGAASKAGSTVNSGGASGGGGYGSAQMNNMQVKVIVEGKTSGKDIYWSNQRYAAELNQNT